MFKSLTKNETLIKILVFAGVGVIILIFLADTFSGGEALETVKRADASEYAAELEEKLSGVLSEIDGIGALTVMLTLEGTEEDVYSERGSDVKATLSPKVRGALVICGGGGNIRVREKVIEAVTKLFDIGANKVCVTN